MRLNHTHTHIHTGLTKCTKKAYIYTNTHTSQVVNADMHKWLKIKPT